MKKSVGIMMCFFWLCTGPLSAAEGKVGSNTPLSGKLSVYGEGFQQAMLLALEEVNGLQVTQIHPGTIPAKSGSSA